MDPYLSTCTKLKSKWIKDLNTEPATLNLIVKKMKSTLERTGTGNYFLCITLVAQTIRATMNKWDLLKLRSVCKAKDTVIKPKRHLTEWEKIFTNPASDKGLIFKIYKELKKLDTKHLTNPLKKMGY